MPNSPINIIDTTTSPIQLCNTRCNYNYNYQLSVNCNVLIKPINILNKQYYVSMTYAKSSNDEAYYSSVPYKVTEIRLYHRSLHKLNGNDTVGECVIVHTNSLNTQQLMVCIPIVESASTNVNDASNLLTQVLNSALSQKTTIIIPDFTTNKLLKSSPFYTYSADSFDQSTPKPTNYIYFYNYSIILQTDIIKKFKGLCGSSQTSFPIFNGLPASASSPSTTPIVSKNDKGPNKLAADDIYIDCKPIDKSTDKVIITKQNYTQGSSSSSFSFNALKQNMILQFLMFFIICVVFMYISYFTFEIFGTIIKPSGQKIK